GWCMPEFGVALPSSTLVIRTHALPSLTAYALTQDSMMETLTVRADGANRSCILAGPAGQFEVRWNADSLKPEFERTVG
ncbi:MAG: hypothetical protein M3Y56_12480, partial [Armatimonadota bacterium]|nr:hypothetical protein [Armatimonadota bacterium]